MPAFAPSPAISVLMAVYNGEKYLHDAIDSILNQTFTDFEFIIIDDASTDKSKDIIKSFNDNRIKLVENNHNLGLTKSLNIAISHATGEFIARMDADDYSIDVRFEKQIAYLNLNPDISFCGSNYMHEDGTCDGKALPEKHDEIKFEMLSLNPFAHPTMMWRRNDFLKHNLKYDENFLCAQDYELWSRAILILKGGNLKDRLLKYRRHEDRIGVKKFDIQENYSKTINLNFLKRCFIELNDETEKYHNAIFRSNFRNHRNPEFISKADEYMCQFREKNLKTNTFCDGLITKKWQEIFFGTNLYEYNFGIWKVMKNSKCNEFIKVNLIKKIKFLVKCLLYHKI